MKPVHKMNVSYISPDWDAPNQVRALSTTRHGGISQSPWDTYNLAFHVGDDKAAVESNRAKLKLDLKTTYAPAWLNQVHGNNVVVADSKTRLLDADAAITNVNGLPLVIMTADCLPILLCDQYANQVAAVHAGWRGMTKGVISELVARFDAAPNQLLAWMGPAISANCYQVRDDVYHLMTANQPSAHACFTRCEQDRTAWKLDLYSLARMHLNQLGITAISGGEYCTYSDDDRFYSYRRDGQTGRMVSAIWLK